MQVVDGPWLNVVELDKLEAFDAELAGERGEDACRRYSWWS